MEEAAHAPVAPRPWPRYTWVGNTLFGLAGALFITVSFAAGFNALIANGIDYVPLPAYTSFMLNTAVFTWWPALVFAIGGLVLWLVLLARRASVLVPGSMLAAMQLLLLILNLVLPGFAPADQ